MTAERKAMTLVELRNKIAISDPVIHPQKYEYLRALDAHLPRAAEPVKRVIEQMNSMRWAGFGSVPLNVVADWATALSKGIGEVPFDGIARDTHPTEDARDAKDLLIKLRGCLQQINEDTDGDNYLNLSCDGMDMIDAAMAQESGE